MEALIRWEHPELGMISPGFFIPIAEDTGLIVPIGEWILRTACADTKRWLDKFKLPLRVSVNLSALQLRQPNLVDVVRAPCAIPDCPATSRSRSHRVDQHQGHTQPDGSARQLRGLGCHDRHR
jgi:EAL domain-containing protein (putative c-di-GMP-specific phosphodiesterase class I)